MLAVYVVHVNASMWVCGYGSMCVCVCVAVYMYMCIYSTCMLLPSVCVWMSQKVSLLRLV